MRLFRLLIPICIAAPLLILASEAPTAEHVKMMKDVNDTNGKLRKGVDVEANSKHLVELAKQVDAFWSTKSDAAKQSSAAMVAGANDLVKAAAANDADAIKAASRMIGGSCKTCHDAHREKISDTEYKIK
jgi:cytochrome c553